MISEAYGSGESGEWENRKSFSDYEQTAGRISRWAEEQTPVTNREPVRMDPRDGRLRDTREATVAEAARHAAGAVQHPVEAARRTADAARNPAEAAMEFTADTGAVPDAAAAAAKAAAAAGSSTNDGTEDSASQKLISKVCQVLTIASSKPHYNKELPVFNGDPLQFLAFKAIFYQSTEVMGLKMSKAYSAYKPRCADAPGIAFQVYYYLLPTSEPLWTH